MRVVLWSVALTLLAGAVAGSLGALLGIGGGVLLVPLLNKWLGLAFGPAAAVSLVGVLATSASVSASASGWQLLNLRLALSLLIFSVSGAVVGAGTVHLVPVRTLELLFGVIALVVAGVMLSRLNRRNVLEGDDVESGALGGRFVDHDTQADVVYRVRRFPLAVLVSAGAGVLASFVGIGGGILLVPVLNSWCGVPMRVAAATSAFMIGVTAVPGVLGFYAAGHLGDFQLAGAAALGVLAGFPLGQRWSATAPVRNLKVLMAVILLVVAGMYLT